MPASGSAFISVSLTRGGACRGSASPSGYSPGTCDHYGTTIAEPRPIESTTGRVRQDPPRAEMVRIVIGET
jgi:hypothetical protein